MKRIIFLLAIAIFSFNTAVQATEDPINGNDHFNMGGNRKGLVIMPNPRTGDAQVLFIATKAANATIKVYDASGKLVLTRETAVELGKNKINIDGFIQLPEGSYSVKLIAQNKQFTGSFVLWK